MKKLLLLLLLINVSITSYSQEVTVIKPTNVIATVNKISGNADFKTTVKLEITDVTGVKTEYSIVVNYKGYFEQIFNPVLTSNHKLKIWTVDETGVKKSEENIIQIETPEIILNRISTGNVKLPINIPPIIQIHINPELEDAQPISTTYNYKVAMVNTNFTIPIARFNLTSNDGTAKDGEILLFNSIGAGVGYSWGTFTKTTDDKGELINSEFISSFGYHFGVLFSAGGSGSENKNVFAPTFSISVLDFQFGYGYEMGTRAPNQKRDFFTIAYAIPIAKLVRGKFYVYSSSKGYNNTNPLPIVIKPKKKKKDKIKDEGKDENIETRKIKNMFVQ